MKGSTFFQKARPVWGKNTEGEMNLFLRFNTRIPRGAKWLHIAAVNVYRLWINGEFIAWGPARTCHGYCRVDEILLTERLTRSENEIMIEVGAYGVNSYEWLDEKGYVQFEIGDEQRIFCATGYPGIQTFRVTEKVQKVERYSFQRTFCEAWQFPAPCEPVLLEEVPQRMLLPRNIPNYIYPCYEITEKIAEGWMQEEETQEPVWPRQISGISPRFKGYPIDQLEAFLSGEVHRMKFQRNNDRKEIRLFRQQEKQWQLLDLGKNLTGLIQLQVQVKEQAQIYLLFDEILAEGDVDWTRLECSNIVRYDLDPGCYQLLTVEPYTFRYLKIIVKKGVCIWEQVSLRLMQSSLEEKQLICPEKKLNRIWEAALRTFRQNGMDYYTDCPSRERAGWLCDSYFMAKAEYAITGNNILEQNFMENYLLPEKFPYIPDKMVPMCYPADHNDGVFIPNWSLWLILQLEDCAKHRRGKHMAADFRERVYRLLEWFEEFENENGLLEDLEGWVFIEWSACNNLTEGINYPTNMLYSRALTGAGNLYGDQMLLDKAQKIKEQICKDAYDGFFFHDQARRVNDRIQRQPFITETCQYYAFFCGIADIQTYPELWEILCKEFGPRRQRTRTYPEVSFSNAFIGNFLRLLLLKEQGERKQMLDEIQGYFQFMAEKTGTLWEHDNTIASCNHGFTSYLICLLEQ